MVFSFTHPIRLVSLPTQMMTRGAQLLGDLNLDIVISLGTTWSHGPPNFIALYRALVRKRISLG